jgi:anti-sigma factor (TIGR02949 family)
MRKNQINCDQALRQVFAYLDRELGERERAAMQEHMRACKGCFSRMEFERLLKGKVKALREEKASPRVSKRVRSLLKAF